MKAYWNVEFSSKLWVYFERWFFKVINIIFVKRNHYYGEELLVGSIQFSDGLVGHPLDAVSSEFVDSDWTVTCWQFKWTFSLSFHQIISLKASLLARFGFKFLRRSLDLDWFMELQFREFDAFVFRFQELESKISK